MNIIPNLNNMANRSVLECAVNSVNMKLDRSIRRGRVSYGSITYARLSRYGYPIIGVEVTEILNTVPNVNRLEYSIVNNSIFQTIPASALCDTIG